MNLTTSLRIEDLNTTPFRMLKKVHLPVRTMKRLIKAYYELLAMDGVVE